MNKRRKEPKDYDYRRAEAISKHQFAERILRYGWKTDEISIDNGQDIQVEILKRVRKRNDFESTRAVFPVQLKATNDLASFTRKHKAYVQYKLEVKNLLEWDYYIAPLIIVVWDISKEEGRWILAGDVTSGLDQNHPSWRTRLPEDKIAIRIPWENTTDNSGLDRLKLRLAPIFIQQASAIRPLTGGRFKVSIPQSDIEKFEEYRSHIAHGTPVTITKPYIVDFQWPDIWDDFFGDVDITEILLESPVSETTQLITLEVEANNHVSGKFSNLEFRKILDGRESVVISNNHQATSIHFAIQVPTPQYVQQCRSEGREPRHTFNFTIRNMGSNVLETANNLTLFDLCKHGGILRLVLHEHHLETEIPIDPGQLPSSIEQLSPDFIRFVDNLCKIQQHTRTRFRLPDDDTKVTLADHRAAQKAVDLIEHGETTMLVGKCQLHFLIIPEHVSDFIEHSIAIVERGEAPVWILEAKEINAEILGKTIDLGQVDVVMEGRIDGSPQEYAKLVRQHDYSEYLVLRFEDVKLTTRYLVID